MDLRELPRGLLADIGNRQRVNPAVQRQRARAFQRLNDLRAVLFAEHTRFFVGAEIQRREFFEF